MSTTNSEALARLVALERLQSLTAEGYPFAALQAKITNRRTDVIAPVGAHASVIKTISDFRTAKKLAPLQLVVVATGREAEETAAALKLLTPAARCLSFSRGRPFHTSDLARTPRPLANVSRCCTDCTSWPRMTRSTPMTFM